MKKYSYFFFRGCRYLLRQIKLGWACLTGHHKTTTLYEKRVELFDQQANDYIYKLLSTGSPCMISKFGMTEMSALANYRLAQKGALSFRDVLEYIQGKRLAIGNITNLNGLYNLSGFFPNDISLLPRFYEVNLAAMKAIDVLGSYIYDEKEFDQELMACKRVNLDGYYAPFYWNNPWTSILKGKKVLVVHPFAEEIRDQYKRRGLLWENPNILPKFELITYKAVQSILGTQTQFPTWFDALDKMKADISQLDFDIALIGCGAYGMPLAAHVKAMGKQAIHLAGWTQVLFGIIGKRWEDNPQTSTYINKYWIRPYNTNVPHNAAKVESGCYW